VPSGFSGRVSRARILFVTIALVAIVLAFRGIGSRDHEDEGQIRVVILDPLGGEGEGFTSSAVELFESAGYEVDVLRGENVSVESVKGISGGYRVVLLRVHSSIYHGRVWVFTGERYRQGSYVLEQLLNEVHPARPTTESEFLFAVGADFALRYLEDGLDDSLVVVMGCDGLSSRDLAMAFTENGAAAYVSWDGPVSLGHTDEATLALLRGLVVEGMCLGDAVGYSMGLVGPDPVYSSSLCFFPEEGGEFSVN